MPSQLALKIPQVRAGKAAQVPPGALSCLLHIKRVADPCSPIYHGGCALVRAALLSTAMQAGAASSHCHTRCLGPPDATASHAAMPALPWSFVWWLAKCAEMSHPRLHGGAQCQLSLLPRMLRYRMFSLFCSWLHPTISCRKSWLARHPHAPAPEAQGLGPLLALCLAAPTCNPGPAWGWQVPQASWTKSVM